MIYTTDPDFGFTGNVSWQVVHVVVVLVAVVLIFVVWRATVMNILMKKKTRLSWLFVPLIISVLAGCSDGDSENIACPSLGRNFVIGASDPNGNAISDLGVSYRFEAQTWQDANCGASGQTTSSYQCSFLIERFGSLEFEVSSPGYKTLTTTIAIELNRCELEPLSAMVILEPL